MTRVPGESLDRGAGVRSQVQGALSEFVNCHVLPSGLLWIRRRSAAQPMPKGDRMERIVAGLWPDIVGHVPAEVSRNSTLIRIHPLNACQSRDPHDQSADANCNSRFKPSHAVCGREASA